MSFQLFDYAIFKLRKVSNETLVGTVRVELTTSRLSGVRSNHLSYAPIAQLRLKPQE